MPELITVGGPLPTLCMTGFVRGAVWPVGSVVTSRLTLGVAIAIYKRSFNIAAIKELNSREAGIARFDKARLKTVGFQDEEL